MKKVLLWSFAMGMVIICGIWFLFGGGITEHITDTNGPDNFSLQSITDENIRTLDMGALGGSESSDSISTTTYHSDKFSGVSVIHQEQVRATGMTIKVYNYIVREGNFRLLVMVDDEILHEFVPNGDIIQTCELGAINGLFSIRIAGESASYKFSYDKW